MALGGKHIGARLFRAIAPVVAVVFVLWATSPEVLGHYGVLRHVSTRDKVVALTFDDGPYPKYTRQILAILDQYHIHATFFMIGSAMEKYPDIVRAVAARGHVIGNHTYTHPRDIRKLSNQEFLDELDRTQAIIKRETGHTTNLFRPPLGIINGMKLVLMVQRGYLPVRWTTCASHSDAHTPELMAARVINNVHHGDIILLHDGRFPHRWKDVAATRLIVEALHNQGYRFVTLPELLAVHKRNSRL